MRAAVNSKLGRTIKKKSMNTHTKRVLFWSPRVLCILFAMFLSLFALDVFDEGYGFWGTILALLIHLAPVYIVIIASVIAWRWEWAGTILFITLAFFNLVLSKSGSWVISGPLIFLGILFLISWIYKVYSLKRDG
jgi:hypothetical protein